MKYKNRPTVKNLSPYDLADGRKWRDVVREIDRKLGVEVVEIEEYDMATGEYRVAEEVER